MKKSSMIALAILAGAFAAPALAGDTDTAATSGTEAAATAEKEKPICRSQKITGTRSKVRRLCLTPTEWAALAEQTRKNMDEFNRSTNSGAPTAKNPLGPS